MIPEWSTRVMKERESVNLSIPHYQGLTGELGDQGLQEASSSHCEVTSLVNLRESKSLSLCPSLSQ